MKNYNRRVLILNADYVPTSIKSWQRAITLLCKDRAVQVDFYKDDIIKGAHGKIYEVPAVVALKKYIHRNYQKAPFSRANVLARDHYTCAFCNKKFHPHELTLDHVIPRSKWKSSTNKTSPTCWTNIVTACFPCNNKKGNRTCEEAGMALRKNPTQPGYDEIFFGLHIHGKIEPEWIKWLEVFPSFKHLGDEHHG